MRATLEKDHTKPLDLYTGVPNVTAIEQAESDFQDMESRPGGGGAMAALVGILALVTAIVGVGILAALLVS